MPSLLISGGPLLSQLCSGLSLSLQPIVGGADGLVCELVGKTDLLSDSFYSKHSSLSDTHVPSIS